MARFQSMDRSLDQFFDSGHLFFSEFDDP